LRDWTKQGGIAEVIASPGSESDDK